MEKVLLFMGVFILISFVSAQKDFLQENKKPLQIGTGNSSDIHIIQILQLWDISTLQAAGSSGIDRRNDLYIRRGQTGLKGKLTKDLSFYVLFAYDGIGRDKNTAGNGSPNASDNHDFYLWDAYWTWNHVPMLNITAGYFRPQVGRESISSAFNVISFEKSLPNNQTRSHILGRISGRETGINLGGIHRTSLWSFNYNLGFFDTNNSNIISTGSK